MAQAWSGARDGQSPPTVFGPDAGSAVDETQGFADKCGQGAAWNTWEPEFGGIVNVGEKFRPLNDANWLRYSGLWGKIGFSADAKDCKPPLALAEFDCGMRPVL